jgi:N-glycosylase/DNA lyase
VRLAKKTRGEAEGGEEDERLVEMGVEDFDLAGTLSCGQVFHWERSGAGWVGAIGDSAVYLEQKEAKLFVSAGEEVRVRNYLSLDHPWKIIRESFPSDPALDLAVEFCGGMRIIRQPSWECLATFITSALKQVAQIGKISQRLRRSFGARRECFAGEVFSYPKAEKIAGLREEDLRACGLGFRAKSLLGAARMIAEGHVDLVKVAAMDDVEAMKELRRLPGVGEKVANCVLLFGFERLEAFPIDVWIERVLIEGYFSGESGVSRERLREFTREYFGRFGGYAQQYLFHHARTTRIRVGRKG